MDGFRHGYAGTISKGQGKTLDHAYLYHIGHLALTRQRESAKPRRSRRFVVAARHLAGERPCLPDLARYIRCSSGTALSLDNDIDAAFGHTGVIGSTLSDGDLLHNLWINPEFGQFIRHDLAASQGKVVVGEL